MKDTRETLVRLFLNLFIDYYVDCSDSILKAEIACNEAEEITKSFFLMFEQCVFASMSNRQFLSDDLRGFVNHPAKTTVGFGPKYTNNRKFFANVLTTTEFKNMLAKDEKLLWNDLRRKVQFCEEVVMDRNILKDFHDRDFDQGQII